MLESEKTAIFTHLFEQHQNVFLTGPAGVGKTELLRYIITNRPDDKRIGVTATTGIAASLLNAVTVHSFLGLGLATDRVFNLVKQIKRNSISLQRWQQIDVLVVDEIGMMTAELLETIELLARILRKSDKLFGNIKVLFAGDFLQLPCIKGDPCFTSKIWEMMCFETFHLRTSIRQIDTKFRLCLNNARLGNLTEEDETLLSECCLKSEGNFVNVSYSETSQIEATRLYCKNVDVNAINDQKLCDLKPKRLFCYNIEINKLSKTVSDDYIKKQCNAAVNLKLAVGAQVMLLVNLDQQNGLVNGSRGVVVSFSTDDCPVVKFKQITRLVGFHLWEIKDNDILLANVYQIPLKLAYAITIHKSQGCTLDSVFVDLKDVFEYGQAYVALSRVKNLESLTLANFDKRQFKADPRALTFYEKLV